LDLFWKLLLFYKFLQVTIITSYNYYKLHLLPFACFSVCLPTFLSVYPSVWLCFSLPTYFPGCPSACLFFRLPTCFPVCLFICITIFLSLYPPSSLSVYLVCLSVSLPSCMSAHLHTHLSICWLEHLLIQWNNAL
jgi:hypothetical protein